MATRKKIKILILGGTKFIGKNLIKKLDKKDFIVDVVSRKKIKFKNKNINKFYNINLDKIEKIDSQIRYDYIIDFISKNKQQINKIFNKINFNSYIFISSAWLAKLNDKINLNKKIDINLVFKKDINRVTKKYLLNKYELENHILIKSKLKKNCKFYILRLPIILGNEDYTDRLNFYFSRSKTIKKQIIIEDKKIFLNLLWVEDICLSLKKMMKKNLWPKSLFLEALNLNKINFRDFLIIVNKRLNLKDVKLLSFKEHLLRKKLKSLFVYDPFINEKNLKITKHNIFKILSDRPKKFDFFIKKIKVKRNKNRIFNINKSKEINFFNTYS